METLQITKADALKAFKDAKEPFKGILKTLFGGQISEKITDRIKTFEDACAEEGVSPESVLPYKEPSNDHERGLNAMAKLMVITKALNEEWTADWNNSNQYKWYPWFRHNGAGFGFSRSNFVYSSSASGVGSRLCFRSEELANYAGTQFLKEFNDFLII